MALDRAHVWHPFTQMKVHEADPPIPVASGEGCDLVLPDGRRLFDGISSWWTNIHGHGHPRIAAAIAAQAAKLDHVIFAGFTHEPAIELMARLKPRLPAQLTRCFFSDNGSTAVEVALKMAFQAQLQKGREGRTRFGALAEGYHGDTLGAVGVGELGNWLTGMFRPLLLHCERLSVPEDPRREIDGDLTGWPEQLEAARTEMRAFFDEHGNTLAAFIAEPLIQGAGGMRMWPTELLAELRAQCDRHGVYLILDEVMTGFGRTGTFLACEQAGIAPDLLCLSKGLTGGVMAMALTWATEELFEIFWANPQEGRAFTHGHSFTANPIACAAACASLALFEEEPVMERAEELGQALREAWTELSKHPALRHARTLGTVAAAQLVDPISGAPRHQLPLEDAPFAWKLHRRALEHGLLIRPMGDCLYLLPPLATPPERVREAVRIIARLLD